jgi:CheY-like chemotaxis protein
MMVEDVTGRPTLENQRHDAQTIEAVGRLVGDVARDFNNLLTAILGYADLALKQAGPEDRWTADVREIRRAAERGTGLTQQLLAFSRQTVKGRPAEVDSRAASGSVGALHRSSGSETVLLVEDDSAVRTLVVTALRRRGYTVLEARDGEEGMDVFARWRDTIDIVVTDVVMPGMGGAALVDWLRKVAPDTKVLYLSGYTEDATVRHRVGRIPFLQKPFTTQALLDKVRGILDTPRPGGAS